ncbi:methylase [Novosphingobium umbonatum]|uniref:Methylase n=2 Tax=Novosphingobium umbonatum TaxID=1908524 RepID=A0A3S2Y8J3_9SPHN|nr:methylase [Novosphingobium umbonatum]
MGPCLESGAKITRRVLNSAMEDAFGAGSTGGAWTQRDSFQMLEIAILGAMSGRKWSADPVLTLAALRDLETQLPTQTVRSQEQVEQQHFSTPLGLAWLAAYLADIQADDVVLEPSAGTGMLAVWARHAGSLYLNEINLVRQEILRRLFPGAVVTGYDAVRIGTHLTERPSVLLMNPPFARNTAGLEDPTTAVRHLAAALGVLKPNGRLVAIMPDSFQPHGRRAELFQRALQGASVAFHARLEGAFTKQGTSIPVRLLVIDKRAGAGSNAVINRSKIADLVPFLSKVPPRRRIECELPLRIALPIAAPKATSPLLGSFRSAGQKLSSVMPCGDANGAIPLAYTLRDTIADAEQAVGVYVAYRPQRLIFENATDHPTQMVESAAMASVALPAPSYVPQLPAKVIRDQVLSRAQLETLVHALDATSSDLTGRYRVPERGLELVPDAEGAIYRRGFFLGDGTGAGKGRQLASILMDQWLRGSRRHLWISESNALIEDARRDWQALGGITLDIQPLSKIKPEARIRQADGILFASYATLRSGTGEKTRLQQLLEWLTADFDGVILFDEAHAMGGVAGGEGRFGATKGSQQGIVGVELQNRLPRARVIYASATGASDVNNLAYAVRLGLWGEGTAFPDRTSFIARIREGGIAAMELVARELKAMGVYTARALSYAGVEYDILEHALTPRQIADFDAYADAWAIIHRNLEAALGASGVTDPLEGKTLNGQALSAARSRFESSKQRFFGQLLLSMKLPSLLPAIEDALATEHSVVIQLVSTAEALLDRRLADLSAEDRAEIQLDLSPREIVADYLDNAFPTRAMESYWDEDGNERSRPIVDEAGNPVHSQEALRIKAETLELLGALPPIVPALDAIISRFGTDAVAEITGRTRRLVTLPDGSQRLESRTANQSLADANAFMGGAKRILVFSDAGGTGRSYHASLDAKNQQRRMHFLLEPGWRADRAIQGLGRTNRTHQASAPVFRPVTTDCLGERRFISTIARRLDALGALTRGQRQTGGQNLFDPADNLESDYAREALTRWYHLLHQGKLTSIGFADFCERTGLQLEQEGCLTDNLPPIQRWLNRILALPIALQNAVFDEFLGLVEARIDAARKAGTFDAGVETLVADKLTIIKERILREDANGASTQLLTLEAQWAPKFTPLAEIVKRIGIKARLLRNGRSSRVAVLMPDRTRLMDDGTPVASFTLHRPGGLSWLTSDELAESHWDDCEREVFEQAWQAEADDLATKPYTERFYLATGRLLPIWNLLGDEAQVRRLVTQDGRSLLGRIVPAEAVNMLLDKLGIGDCIALSPEQLVDAALGGKVVPIDVLSGTSLKRSRVNGEQRLEVIGFDPRALLSWKAKGCFTEIIAYQTRLFMPVSSAREIVEALAA